jgi:subtilisin family serine protease
MRPRGRLPSAPPLRRHRTLLVAALVAGGVVGPAATASAAPPHRTAVIVQLADGSDPAAESRQAAASDGQVSHVFASAFHGFAAELPGPAIAALQRNPNVTAIEPDVVVSVTDTQPGAPWGLDRIDQQALPLTGSYNFPAGPGAGVTAYIVDTGVAPTADLDQRRSGYDVITPGGDGSGDCNGHGTHVAGTIGGSTYGVARGVNLTAVRVLDCTGSGSTAGVIAGIDWVTANHPAGKPAVANMSLGGAASTALDDAVTRSIQSGVTYAIAAGNGNASGIPQDACKSSPARVPAALTVGATDKTDAPASFSNYGNCVDLFAPGVGITSDWYTSTTATNTISGTSMATPHVTGVAALYLQTRPTAGPATVSSAITALTTKDVVRTTRTSNNDLLFSNF